MAHLKIHGFVQIVNKKSRKAKLKEALVEIVEGEEEVELVVSSKSKKSRWTFQLSNIASVVLRRRGRRVYHLNLMFKNNTFLLVNKLYFTDLEQMKTFLNTFHQNGLPLMKPEPAWNVAGRRSPQKVMNKPQLHNVWNEPVFKFFRARKGSGTPFPKELPWSMSNSPTLLVEKETFEKRKSSQEMSENSLKEDGPTPNKKFKRPHLKNTGKKRERSLSSEVQEKGRDPKVAPPSNNSTNGNPNLNETVLPTPILSDKRSLVLPLESEHIQDSPSCNEAPLPLNTHPKISHEGFPNLGNTCYMNAVLQSLFAIPTLANDLFTQGIPWENVPNNLIVPFSLLFALKDVSEENTKIMLLLNIKNSVSAVATIFCDNSQNDAHEFLGQCLDQLKEDMKSLNNVWCSQLSAQGENARLHTCAGDLNTNTFVCPIVNNFELELQASIVCRACGQTSFKTELNNYLSINLDREQKAFPLSIQNYLDLFFGPEEVDYNCEKCKSKNSVFTHKFRRLPRVLIVHLKRYSVNKEWLLEKNYQQVEIPKYLKLSSHCDENTKPPLPLDSRAPERANHVLKVSQEMVPEMLGPSPPSVNDSTVLHTGPDGDGELGLFQRACEGADTNEQQGSLETQEPQLVKAENGTLPDNMQPALDLMVDEGEDFLPVLCKLIGIPCSDVAENGLQEVPEDPVLKSDEKNDLVGAFDGPTSTELLEDNLRESNTAGGDQSQGMDDQLKQKGTLKINKEFLQQSPPPRVRKSGAQKDPEEDLGRSSKVSLQGNLHSLSALETTEAEGKEHTTDDKPDNSHAYRLISVISHLGNLDSGHYVSDVYDFQKQAWFLYSDMWVSEIPEAVIQKLRRHDGYIFFYMHNEIFEVLLGRGKGV